MEKSKKTVTIHITVISLLFFLMLGSASFLAAASDEALPQPYVLDAQDIQYDYQDGLIVAEGDVSYQMADLSITADRMQIDTNNNIAEASGDKITLKTAGEELTGTYLKYNYGEGTGSIYDAESKVGDLLFKGNEIKLLQNREYTVEILKASFTPCIMDDPHYHIRAKRVLIYPDLRVVGRKVQFWFGKIKIITLPGYVIEYEEEEGKMKNSLPIPELSYDRDKGAVLEFYYPYQYNERLGGKISASINSQEEKEGLIEANYLIKPGFALKGSARYSEELDEDDLLEEEGVIKTGLEYNKGPYRAYSGLEYDYLNEETYLSNDFQVNLGKTDLKTTFKYNLDNHMREEGIKVSYRPLSAYRLDLSQEYENEKPVKESYSISYSGEPVNWKLIQKEGYEYDYLPQLELSKSGFRLAGVELSGNTALGRVKNEGVSADRFKLDLGFKHSLSPAPDLEMAFEGRSLSYIYQNAQGRQEYQVYQVGIKTNYQHSLSKKITLDTEMEYELTAEKGRAVLPDDREEALSLIKPGLEVSYHYPEPGSAVSLALNGEYELDKREWKESKISLIRKFDCYSFSLDYNILKGGFGFSFNL